MPRRKKYNAKSLEKAVNAYFDALSYEKPALTLVPTGKTAKNGNPEMRYEQVRTRDGQQALTTGWIEPPSVTGLCLHLGISRETWSAYTADEKLGPVASRAKARIESAYVARLAEGGKGMQGLIFVLKNNFGWADQVKVGMDQPTRNAVAGSAMTIREKEKILRQIAQDFGDRNDEA